MQTRPPLLPDEDNRRPGVDSRLDGTFLTLLAAGLEPVRDDFSCAVRSGCPRCHAERADPLGLHRPLTVGCFTRDLRSDVRMTCVSGCEPAAIRRALREAPIEQPSPDWQTIAEAYENLAADALALLDTALEPQRTTRPLEAVA